MKNVFLFSGQGSQYVGMMNDFYENNGFAKSQLSLANDILGFNISNIMFEGPVDILKETRYTQIALFLHSSIIFDLIKNKKEFSATAGHSVGEFAGLYASGVLNFKDALELVALRGKLMFEVGNKIPGTMFAVVGMSDEDVIKTCEEFNRPEVGNVVVPANFNSTGQVVISGSQDYLRSISGEFKTRGAKLVKELQVSGAFHSPLLNEAKIELEEKIKKMQFNNAIVPIYSNVSASAENEGNRIQSLLIEQIVSPVKWTQILNNLKQDGFDTYIEIGAGNVLQGLVKRTLSDVEIFGIDKYVDFQNFS